MINLTSGRALPCLGENSDLWTSEDASDRLVARIHCYGCPALRPCSDLGSHQVSGVWGGVDRTVPLERIPTRRRRHGDQAREDCAMCGAMLPLDARPQQVYCGPACADRRRRDGRQRTRRPDHAPTPNQDPHRVAAAAPNGWQWATRAGAAKAHLVPNEGAADRLAACGAAAPAYKATGWRPAGDAATTCASCARRASTDAAA